MKKIFHFGAVSPESRTALNFTALQGFFWFAWSFSCYGIVYLQNIGFQPSQIGTLNAISSAVAIVAMMLWGFISDRINSIKITFIIALICTAVAHSITPFLPADMPYSVIMFFLYYPFVNFFRCSLATLLDNLTVRTCAEKRVNYGVVRSFGSFTFTIASIIIVFLIPVVGVGATFWLSGLLMIPALIALLFAHDPKIQVNSTDKHKKLKISPVPLLKNYYYMTFMFFVAIVFIAFSSSFAFITYYMADIGISNSNFGTFLAVRAAAEVPLLLLIVHLRRKFKLKYLVIIACCIMSCESLFLGLFANDLGGILFAGALFGLGNGIFLGTVSLYIYKLAPDNLKATSQTIYAAVCSISGIIGNLVGGFAYQAMGCRPFYTLLGCIILFGTSVLFVAVRLRPNLPNPADEMATK